MQPGICHSGTGTKFTGLNLFLFFLPIEKFCILRKIWARHPQMDTAIGNSGIDVGRYVN